MPYPQGSEGAKRPTMPHRSERSHGYSRDIYHGRTGPGGHYRDQSQDDSGRFWPVQTRHERSYEYGPESYYGEPYSYDGPEGEGIDTMDTRGAGLTRNIEEPYRRWGGSTFRPYTGPTEHAGMRHGGFPSQGGYENVTSDTWELPGPYTGKGPKGYRRSDERIHEDVCERLTAHGGVDASQITLDVEQGEVTLEGTVADRRTKRIAEAVTDSVRGVEDVHNRLRLERHVEAERRPDDEEAGEPAH